MIQRLPHPCSFHHQPSMNSERKFILLTIWSVCVITQAHESATTPKVFSGQMSTCPCRCRIGVPALRNAQQDCNIAISNECAISLCQLHNRAGFSCCYEDLLVAEIEGFETGTPEASYWGPCIDHDDGDAQHLGVSRATVSASATASITPSGTASMTATASSSGSASPSVTAIYAVLHYASDNEAFVYVNGNMVSALSDWRVFATVSIALKNEDVIAIRARSHEGWYGVIAALSIDGRWFVTGKDEWKARKAFNITIDDELWTVPFFYSCSWRRCEPRANAHLMFDGKAKGFPYESGASYVWAHDAGADDTIFMRFVIGGEDCSFSNSN